MSFFVLLLLIIFYSCLFYSQNTKLEVCFSFQHICVINENGIKKYSVWLVWKFQCEVLVYLDAKFVNFLLSKYIQLGCTMHFKSPLFGSFFPLSFKYFEIASINLYLILKNLGPMGPKFWTSCAYPTPNTPFCSKLHSSLLQMMFQFYSNLLLWLIPTPYGHDVLFVSAQMAGKHDWFSVICLPSSIKHVLVISTSLSIYP